MRAPVTVPLVFLPAFGLWWAGYFLEDAGHREVAGWLVRWPLGLAVAAALGLGVAGAVRADRRDAALRLGAAILVGLAWVGTVVAADLAVLLAHRESGPEPHLVLPLTWATCASLPLAVAALGAQGTAGRTALAAAVPLLAGLAVPVALLVLATVGAAF